MITQELIDYIAHSQDGYAQRLREVLLGSLTELLQPVIAFGRWSERFDHRHIMRRKVRRVLRG